MLVTAMRESATGVRRQGCLPRGFTMVELAVVLVVAATLAIVATPSLVEIVVGQRLRAAASDLVSSLYLARSEAIKRNANVTIRPAVGDAWTGGWVVSAAGGEQIDRRTPPGNRVRVTRAPETIVYTPSGRLDPLGVARVEFGDSEGHPGIPPRCVTVDTAGLPRLEARACT